MNAIDSGPEVGLLKENNFTILELSFTARFHNRGSTAPRGHSENMGGLMEAIQQRGGHLDVNGGQ